MEFTQLIAPSGEWGKIWLAAHWEKKLKKQDYVDIDLRALIASFLARRTILSLRATGHLLVGGCKVFARKCQILEEEVQEVRQKLFMAFSEKGRGDRQGVGGGEAAGAGGAGRLGALLREVDAELALVEPQAEDALLGGRRHLARLEDITLRAPPASDLAPGLAGLAGLVGEELGTGADFEAALREFLGTVLPPLGLPPQLGAAAPDTGLDTQPLVGADGPQEEAEARGSKRPLEPETPAATDLDTPMPLDMDLPPAEDDVALAPRARGLDEADDLGFFDEEGAAERIPGIADRDAPKRRRRDRCIFDSVTEIPKATYQAFVNDRSAITREKILDYNIVLPHYSPSLPDFMTTFTDLCPELNDCLRWGKDVAERARLQRKELEMGALPGREAAVPVDDLARAGEPRLPLSGAGAAAAALLDPNAKGLAGGGRSSPSRGPAADRTERSLLKDAPRTMSAAVLANPASEEAAGGSEARVGYSGRTEKMHRYLAREFHEASANALSYQGLCRRQASGRRELVAGSFFELLVLKTNGVIGLQQESPSSDIRISKASQWAA